jgi:hypothetical protein
MINLRSIFQKPNHQKIIFEEADLAAKHLLEIPKPISTVVPQWFKKDYLFSNGVRDVLEQVKSKTSSGASYKMCVPLTDSMTAGYVLTTSAAATVKNVGTDEYVPYIEWRVDWNVCDTLQEEALQNYPIPYGYSRHCFRWYTNWIVRTPKNYSLWVTHPAHRHDLPFFTLNGFVDTDRHPNKLLLPFFVREGFEGVIPAGTPIAQIIPVKRDTWKSKKTEFNPDSPWLSLNNIKMDLVRTYKNRYWAKKRYL